MYILMYVHMHKLDTLQKSPKKKKQVISKK